MAAHLSLLPETKIMIGVVTPSICLLVVFARRRPGCSVRAWNGFIALARSRAALAVAILLTIRVSSFALAHNSLEGRSTWHERTQESHISDCRSKQGVLLSMPNRRH